MIEIKNKDLCCGCGSCYNACPKKCIEMMYDNEGFSYPFVDSRRCIHCNICEKVCPIISFKSETTNIEKETYAAFNNDNSIRISSSSGGLFFLFAQKVLKENGVVYGASFENDFSVSHIMIEKVDDLPRLMGAKYVQSDIKQCYSEIKTLLEGGKIVYFSGTPCQVEALKVFLDKEYENLITQDIVCHGVPSYKLLHIFLKQYPVVKNLSFRDKTNGWMDYSIKINQNYINHNDCSFMKAFIKGYILRPSCYACVFKKRNRVSDITLGDLWGIDNFASEMNDNKGASLLVINSKKGKMLLNSIRDKATLKKIDFETAILFNSSYIKSTICPKKRDKFIKDTGKYSFDYLVYKKYAERHFFSYMKALIRNILHGKRTS